MLIHKAVSFYLNRICRRNDAATKIRERATPRIWQKDFHVLNFINRNIQETFKKYNLHGKEVLDLGCGLKPYKSLMNSRTYIGVDAGMAAARPDVIADLNFPLKLNKTFDVVVLYDSLEHIRNTQEVIETTKAHLRPGGFLVISAPFFYFVHGEPWDFYRFTSFYFKDLDRQNFEPVSIKASNSYLSSFFLIANNIIWYPLPIPYFIKYLLYFFMNIAAMIIDGVFVYIVRVLRSQRFNEFVYMCTLEYFVVYRRK